ncbi:MAG: TetR/AcrR family transcriptional regulator [Vicinamibacteria bacterium]
MGIAERRARQKTSLRRQILDAALQMFAEEGYEAVTMRRLAQRIEYSPTAIYLHFADKDDLFRAVSDETFSGLIRRIERRRRAHADDPVAALRAGLTEYATFGLKHPEHYMVTFMLRQKAVSLEAFQGSVGAQAFGTLVDAVGRCVAGGHFRRVDVGVTAQVLWASVHGLVALHVVKKPFPFAPAKVLIETQIDTLVRGLLK